MCKLLKKYLIIFVLILISGCRELSNYKPIMQDINKQEAKDIINKPEETKPIKLSIPLKNKEKTKKELYPKSLLVPINVFIRDNINVKEVLIEIAKQAKVDLTLDPSIDKKIIFSANNKPFIDIIEQICDIADLRFEFVNNTLKITNDTPYTKNYNLQFLNIERSTDNKLEVSTDIFNNNSTKSSNDNGSKSSLKVLSKNDFWQELDESLKSIISFDKNNAKYSINKQAGLVFLTATQKVHKQVAKYFAQLKRIACSQVLIEAKIIEVSLKDQYRSGINWQKVGTKQDWQINAPFGDFAKKSDFLDPTQQTDMVSFGAQGTQFSSIVNILQEFGMVRTLSSPRLTVMNNQAAVLKVAQNKVYFRLNYDKIFNATNDRENLSVSSDIQTVPIGLIMLVQPSIDLESDEVILFLRPTISRLAQSVSDPAVDIAYNASTKSSDKLVSAKPSLIPVVEVREIDSILRVKNKEMAVLGGLMEVRSAKQNNEIPGLGDIPVIRDLTGSLAQGDSVVELVIVLKASIIENDDVTIPQADERLMTQYTKDPRPFIQ